MITLGKIHVAILIATLAGWFCHWAYVTFPGFKPAAGPAWLLVVMLLFWWTSAGVKRE